MRKGFFYKNSLTIVFLLLFIASLVGQLFTGWNEYNNDLKDDHYKEISLTEYLTSGHFISSTFENWESEFLQMALFVILTRTFRQKGSSESKKLEGKEEVDKDPDPDKKDAPWPVHKGGLVLTLYKHSLSIVLLLLYVFSFCMHVFGSFKDYNGEQVRKGHATETVWQYLSGSRLWFESFQNWQSEFLSIVAIVLLSIYLRQQGSPQSKPVDAPFSETGE
ncbi:DUF6766 family protein [Segetibacter aerophilus]|uniref:Transmembrane protein n=1 Tax=Segetibacter aerophilus TaxID=670293 RepID=A0A512BD08_9BACT|nr:DUF6766 family protein [Segetibacter aerophilus]GEO09838.1 hypothetical protein SAE01_23340 [Segetibacter aerophilus]